MLFFIAVFFVKSFFVHASVLGVPENLDFTRKTARKKINEKIYLRGRLVLNNDITRWRAVYSDAKYLNNNKLANYFCTGIFPFLILPSLRSYFLDFSDSFRNKIIRDSFYRVRKNNEILPPDHATMTEVMRVLRRYLNSGRYNETEIMKDIRDKIASEEIRLTALHREYIDRHNEYVGFNYDLLKAFLLQYIWLVDEISDEAEAFWRLLRKHNVVVGPEKLKNSKYSIEQNLSDYLAEHPRVKILVIGCGHSFTRDHKSHNDILDFIQDTIKDSDKFFINYQQHCLDDHRSELSIAYGPLPTTVGAHPHVATYPHVSIYADFATDAIWEQFKKYFLTFRSIKIHQKNIFDFENFDQIDTRDFILENFKRLHKFLETDGLLEIAYVVKKNKAGDAVLPLSKEAFFEMGFLVEGADPDSAGRLYLRRI